MKKIIFLLLLAFQIQAQTLQYLIVGAGGSNGGSAASGGAGGGGVISNTLTATTGTFAVTIGAAVPSNNGQNSSALGFTAIGGGYGGLFDGEYENAPSEPSGGAGPGVGFSGAAGTSGQSFAGGNGTAFPDFSGGGGGGAGAIGGNAVTTTGGNGGAGITSTISGSSYVYGSGGGAYGTVTGGTGGTGAGNGSSGNGSGTNATNYGGGGGGGGYINGGDGFQGVVIIRYLTAEVTATGGTITTDGASTIHTFTSSGNFIITAVSGGSPNVSGIRIFFQQ